MNKVIKLSKVVKADQKMSIFCVQPILPYILVGSFAGIDFASSRRIGSEMTSPSSLVGNLFGDSINHGSLIRESRSVIRALRSRMDGKSITILHHSYKVPPNSGSQPMCWPLTLGSIWVHRLQAHYIDYTTHTQIRMA